MLPTGNQGTNNNRNANIRRSGMLPSVYIGYSGPGRTNEMPTQLPQNIARNMFDSIQEENEALMDLLGVPRIDIPLVRAPITPPLRSVNSPDTRPTPPAPARHRRDPSTLPAALFQPPIDPNPFNLTPPTRPGLTLRDLLPPVVMPGLMQNTLLPAVLAREFGLGLGMGLGLGVGGEHDELMRALNHSLQHSEGSYASVISEEGKKQLKEESYHKPDDLDEPEECPIMHMPFEEGETVIRLPCEHVFGADAIRHWLEKEKAECPVCRFKMDSVEVRKKREAVPAPPAEERPLTPRPPDVPPATNLQPSEHHASVDEGEMERTRETTQTDAPLPDEINDDDDDDEDDPTPSFDAIYNEVREALFGNPSLIQMLPQRRLVPPTPQSSTNTTNQDDMRSLQEAGVFDDMSSDPAIQALLFESLNMRNQE